MFALAISAKLKKKEKNLMISEPANENTKLEELQKKIENLHTTIQQLNARLLAIPEEIAVLRNNIEILRQQHIQLKQNIEHLISSEQEMHKKWANEDWEIPVLGWISRWIQEKNSTPEALQLKKREKEQKQQERERQQHTVDNTKQQLQAQLARNTSELSMSESNITTKQSELQRATRDIPKLSDKLKQCEKNQETWMAQELILSIQTSPTSASQTICIASSSAATNSTLYHFTNSHWLREALTQYTDRTEQPPVYQKMQDQGEELLRSSILQFLRVQFPIGSIPDIEKLYLYCKQNLLKKIVDGISLKKLLPNGVEKTEALEQTKILPLLAAICFDSNSPQSVAELTSRLLNPFVFDLEAELFKIHLNELLPSLPTNLQPYPVQRTTTSPHLQSYPTDPAHPNNQMDFNKVVLKWTLADLQKPSTLLENIPPLPAQFTDTWTYYNSFLPLILEETRITLQQGLDSHIQPIILELTNLKVAQNQDNPSTLTMIGHLPRDFEQGTSCIGLLLEPTKQNPCVTAPILALASYQDRETSQKIFKIKLIMPLDKNVGPIIRLSANKVENMWRATVLDSLVDQQRMYNVCFKKPYTKFQQQLLSAQIDAPTPTTSPSIEGNNHPGGLNCFQHDAVNKFLARKSGLQFLQGPPGTGKTTAIVNLLEILYRKKQRVLVCAPSNKAVQVLASRFLERNPKTAIIFSGIPSKLPPNLRSIFLHTKGQDLCDQILLSTNRIEALFKDKQLTQSKIIATITLTAQELANVVTDIINIAPSYYDYALWENIFSHMRSVLETTSKSLEAILQTLQQIYSKLHIANSKTNNSPSPLETEILNQARIVFSTLCIAGRQSMQEMNKIDILIIDEASQAVEAKALIPLALDPQKCLIVGDTKQLPATVLSQEAKKLNFDRSLMWRLVEDCKQECDLLKIQYRMHPAIRSWPSQQYYGNQLQDASSVTNRPSLLEADYPAILAPCSFIDIAGQELNEGSSFGNRQEALCIMRILQYLNKKLPNINKQVGIITFYSGQVKLISDMIHSNYPAYQNITVHTVDGFQGDERNFVIISFVRANKSNQVGFLKDFRRLNVAITRSRLSLIMLGNVETLTKGQSDVALLIENMRQRNLLFPESALNQALQPPQKASHPIVKPTLIPTAEKQKDTQAQEQEKNPSIRPSSGIIRRPSKFSWRAPQTCPKNHFINQQVVKISADPAILAQDWKNPEKQADVEKQLANFVLQKQTDIVDSVAYANNTTLVFFQNGREIYSTQNACTTSKHIQCNAAKTIGAAKRSRFFYAATSAAPTITTTTSTFVKPT